MMSKPRRERAASQGYLGRPLIPTEREARPHPETAPSAALTGFWTAEGARDFNLGKSVRAPEMTTGFVCSRALA